MHLDLIFAIEKLTDARIELALRRRDGLETADAEKHVHDARRELLKTMRAAADQTP